MHGVEPQVSHPRLVLVLLDETNGFADQTIRKVFTIGSIRKFAVSIRREEARWSSIGSAADIDIESLPNRRNVIRDLAASSDPWSNMPFAEKGGGISCFFQTLCNSDMLRIQLRREFSRLRSIVLGEEQSRQVRG